MIVAWGTAELMYANTSPLLGDVDTSNHPRLFQTAVHRTVKAKEHAETY